VSSPGSRTFQFRQMWRALFSAAEDHDPRYGEHTARLTASTSRANERLPILLSVDGCQPEIPLEALPPSESCSGPFWW